MAKRRARSRKQEHDAIPEKYQGIPRTFTIAQKLGYRVVKAEAPEKGKQVKNFVAFTAVGARPNSICGFGASSRPGYHWVCYKNDQLKCNWVEVPKAKKLAHA
jgi:hypothetical protein